MSELTEISRAENHYPYNINLSSMSGFKAVQVTDSTAFEQLSLLSHMSSIDESIERCKEKCQAKMERARILASKSMD